MTLASRFPAAPGARTTTPCGTAATGRRSYLRLSPPPCCRGAARVGRATLTPSAATGPRRCRCPPYGGCRCAAAAVARSVAWTRTAMCSSGWRSSPARGCAVASTRPGPRPTRSSGPAPPSGPLAGVQRRDFRRELQDVLADLVRQQDEVREVSIAAYGNACASRMLASALMSCPSLPGTMLGVGRRPCPSSPGVRPLPAAPASGAAWRWGPVRRPRQPLHGACGGYRHSHPVCTWASRRGISLRKGCGLVAPGTWQGMPRTAALSPSPAPGIQSCAW